MDSYQSYTAVSTTRFENFEGKFTVTKFVKYTDPITLLSFIDFSAYSFDNVTLTFSDITPIYDTAMINEIDSELTTISFTTPAVLA